MEYRNIGDSEINASVIAFGAWAAGGWMWGSTDRKDAVEAIVAAYEVGVTTIDTAPIYEQGASEEIVGEVGIDPYTCSSVCPACSGKSHCECCGMSCRLLDVDAHD